MKIISTLLFCIICTTGHVMAQNITGIVLDEHQNPLPYANVIIQNESDSTDVLGTLTLNNGSFKILAAENKTYSLSVSFIGFHPQTISSVKGGDIGTISLKRNDYDIGEVVVVGKQIQNKANGYEINFENIPIAKGKLAVNLLEFLPGITFQEGSVQILSQSPHAIYIDGFKIQNIKELESIPASDILSVDVDYTAGVDESASAKGGVLRIKLKKVKDGGYSGYLYGTTTASPYYGYNGESLSNAFRAKHKKISVNNTISYNRYKANSDSEQDQYFKAEQLPVHSETDYSSWSIYLSNRLNITYDISEDHSISVSGLYNNYNKKPETETNYFKNNNEYSSMLYSPSITDNIQAIANYTGKINDKGGKLVVTADYLRNNLEMNQSYTTDIADVDNSHNIQHTDMLRFKPIFSQTMGEGMFSVGGDMQYIRYQDEQTNFMELNGLNTFMHGYVPAIFSSYAGSIKNFSYDVGVRLQGNIMEVETEDVLNEHKNFGIYPIVNLMYKINPEKEHFATLGFKRGMDALPYSAISTYKQMLSPNSYTIGNPNLTSPISNEFMGMVSLFNKLTFTAGYMYFQNQIYYATLVDPANPEVIYTTPKNSSFQSVMLFGIEGRLKPFKWWQTKLSAQFILNSAETETLKVNNQQLWSFSMNNSFNFSSSFGAGLNISYEPNSSYYDMQMKSVVDVTGYLYKSFFDGNMVCRVNFKPYRKGRVTITETNDYIETYINRTKEQYVSLSFTWYFKGGKKVNVQDNAQGIQTYEKIENSSR